MNLLHPRYRRLFRQIALFVASSVFAAFALAQSAETPTDEKVVELEKYTVTTSIDSYHQSSSTMAAKLPMDLGDMASSLSILNASAIGDRNAVAITDVFAYMTGASRVAPDINAFTFRGFSNTGSYTQNIQVDGLLGVTQKKSGGSAANVDRIEFLKGPNGVLYGQMNPGGLLNIITKSPQEVQSTTIRTVAATYAGEFNDPGSKNNFTASIDTTGPITQSKSLLYRVIVDLESNPSSRAAYAHTFTFYPSLTYQWSKDTALTFKGELAKDKKSQEDGLVTVFPSGVTFGPSATFVTAPHNTVYEQGSDYLDDHGYSASLFYHTTLAGWRFNAQWRSTWHVDQTKEWTISNANMFVPAGQFATSFSTLLKRQYNNFLNGHRYNHGDANLSRTFGPEKFQQTVLVGAGGGREFFGNRRLGAGPNEPLAGAQPILNPVIVDVAYPADGTGATDSATKWESLGEYVSDQIKIGDLHLSLGLRHDHIKIDGLNKLNPGPTAFSKLYDTYTKSVGALYKVRSQVSIYGSWSQSLKPATALSFDINGNSNFPPERGEQYEAGFKFESADKKLNATLATYEITRANVIAATGQLFTVPTGGAQVGQGIFRIDGQQQSRCVELEFQWQPVPNWQIQAGAAESRAIIKQSDKNPASVGKVLIGAPEFTANFWTRYNLPSGKLKGLGIGAGWVYVDSVWTGDPTTTIYFKTPSWARADAALYYKFKGYDLALNISNLFDRRYYASETSGINVQPGEQRKLTLSLTRRF